MDEHWNAEAYLCELMLAMSTVFKQNVLAETTYLVVSFEKKQP